MTGNGSSPTTRAECNANTRGIRESLGSVVSSIDRLAGHIKEQRKEIGELRKDTAEIRQAEKVHRAWHNGQEVAEAKAGQAEAGKKAKAGLTWRAIGTILTAIALFSGAMVYVVSNVGNGNDSAVIATAVEKGITRAMAKKASP